MTAEISFFFFFAISIAGFDYLLWRSYTTPIFLSLFPIALLIFVNQAIAIHFGFNDLSGDTESLIVFLYAWTIALLVSVIVRFLFVADSVRAAKIHNTSDFVVKIKSTYTVFHIIVLFVLIFDTYILFLLLSPGLTVKDVAAAYLANGFGGHISQILLLSYCYVIGLKPRLSFVTLSIAILCLLPPFIYGGRGWIFIAVLAGIFFRGFKHGIWPSRLFLFLSPLLSILFVVFTYLYRDFISGTDSVIDQTFEHVIGYLVAGIQGASQLLTSDADPSKYAGMTFNGILNVIAFLSGSSDYSTNVAPDFWVINQLSLQQSNVHTLYGTVFFGLGYFYATIYFIVYFLIFYFFYFRAQASKNEPFLIFYSFMLSGLFLGFFEHYLGSLFYLEILFFLIIINFFSKSNYFRREHSVINSNA